MINSLMNLPDLFYFFLALLFANVIISKLVSGKINHSRILIKKDNKPTQMD